MAQFVLRIELHGHGHDSPAYDRLHAALAAKNVLRVVRGDGGASFRLPSATYAYEGDFTNVAVRKWISEAVDALGYEHWIIVTAGLSSWQLPPRMTRDTPATLESPNIGRTNPVPGTPVQGDPMHDLYPAMDARFLLMEVGRLTARVDRLIDDVSDLGGKVDALRGQSPGGLGTAWVLDGLVLLLGATIAAATLLAIVSGRMSISFH